VLCPSSAHAQGGVPVWTNRFNGLGNGNDSPGGGYQIARCLAVDGIGNVFVTGRTLNAETNYDYVTIKYSNGGAPLWTNYYDGFAHGDDGARAISVDSNGNVFVTGVSAGDFLTIKYSSTGVPLWTNRFDGLAHSGDQPWAIAVGSSGNTFVTGGSYDGSQFDYATVAYSNEGMPLWTNFYAGPANHYDEGNFIAVDSNGNVIVAGYSENALNNNNQAYATIKYSSAGDLLWMNFYDGLLDQSGRDRDHPNAMAVDASGNVFLAGQTFDGTNTAFAIVAYSNDGVPLWTELYTANYYDVAYAIAVDSGGNVFVTGQSWNGSRHEMATIKYSADGMRLWTRRYKGPGTGEEIPFAIAVDNSGNVFVTVLSSGASGSSDYATIAYSNSGVPLWTNRYNGPANGYDAPNTIAVDRNANVFVTGQSTSTNGTYDIVTIKYSSSIPPPRLDSQRLNNQLVLNWANAGFNLQTAPAVTGPFTNLPAATSPYTNPLTAPQQFFRLEAR
jgi:hypothetical protein